MAHSTAAYGGLILQVPNMSMCYGYNSTSTPPTPGMRPTGRYHSMVASTFGVLSNKSSRENANKAFDGMLQSSSAYGSGFVTQGGYCSTITQSSNSLGQGLARYKKGKVTSYDHQVFDTMPQSYSLHNMDRRCVLVADGTKHTYFALPTDYPLKLITMPVSPSVECDVDITTSPPPAACLTPSLRRDSSIKATSGPLATPIRAWPLSAIAPTSTSVAVADHATAAALCVDFSFTTAATPQEDKHHKFKHAPQVTNMMINSEVVEAETILQQGQFFVGTKEDQELLNQTSAKIGAMIECNKKWVQEMQRKCEREEIQRELKYFFRHAFDLFDEMPEFVIELRNDNGSVTSNFDHSLEDTSEYLNETLVKDDDICLDSFFLDAFNLFDEEYA